MARAPKLSIYATFWRSVFLILRARQRGTLIQAYLFLRNRLVADCPWSDHRNDQARNERGEQRLLIHALVHCAYRDKYFLALIDGRDSFDPCGLDNASLRQLLWVRCAKL